MNQRTHATDPDAVERAGRLRSTRSARGLSQGELAERCGLSGRSAIYQIETCRSRGTVDTWWDIAAALDVDAGWLVFGGCDD